MRYPPVGPVTAVYSADVSLPLATTWALTTTPPLESKTVPAIVPRSDCARDTPVHTRQKTPSKMKRKNKDFDCIAPPRPVATQRGTRRASLCTERADHTVCDRFFPNPRSDFGLRGSLSRRSNESRSTRRVLHPIFRVLWAIQLMVVKKKYFE